MRIIKQTILTNIRHIGLLKAALENLKEAEKRFRKIYQ